MWLDIGMEINPAALRVIRQRSGMTVTSCAAAAGIKQSHLSNIEAGRRKASPEVIIALADALRVELPAILALPARPAA
jgi:transcriptional regulator with XRE-family HTH domain